MRRVGSETPPPRPLQVDNAETGLGRYLHRNDRWARSSPSIGFFGWGSLKLRRKTSSNIQHPTSCGQGKISIKVAIRSRICDFDPPRNGLEGKISAKVGLHIHIQESGHAGAVWNIFLLSTPPITKLRSSVQNPYLRKVGRTTFLVLRFRTIKNTFWRLWLVSDGVEVLRNENPKREQIYRGSKKLQIGYSWVFLDLAA